MKHKKARAVARPAMETLPAKNDMRRRGIMQIAGLLFICVIAVSVRLYPIISHPETQRNGFGPFGDTFYYHTLAFNLYSGHGYSATHTPKTFGEDFGTGPVQYKPAIFRPPAYPFFLSIIYKFFGLPASALHAHTWSIVWDRVRIAQSILDSLCCVLIFLAAKTIYPKSFWLPLISAFLYSFSLYNIYYTRALLSETVATFLLTSFILFAIQAIKGDALPKYFLRERLWDSLFWPKKNICYLFPSLHCSLLPCD